MRITRIMRKENVTTGYTKTDADKLPFSARPFSQVTRYSCGRVSLRGIDRHPRVAMITSVAKRCKGDGKRQCGAASQPHERLGEPSRYPHLQHFSYNEWNLRSYLYSIIVFSFYRIYFPRRAPFQKEF